MRRAFKGKSGNFGNTAPLRLTVAAVFLWTSLVFPVVEAHARDRAFGPRPYQHDEFSTSSSDAAYFSPRSLRERMERMDNWILGQNARLAWLQGRGDPAASEEYSDQVRRYSVERFIIQGEMTEELEAKRALRSKRLAEAGGFRFKRFKDGRREWYKNGRVQRVENEKVIQNGRELRRDTLDMTYDARGNLSGYRTETRDETGRVMGTSRWQGAYSEGRRRNARLLSFTETSWDALGNQTQLARTNIQWTSDGKKTLSYTDTETDSYGRTNTREVTGSAYNTDGQLTSYNEQSTNFAGEVVTKNWSDGKYLKDAKGEWRLAFYRESTTDAAGRRTEKEWREAKYDEKGRITGFTEKNTGSTGKTSTRRWENGRYDDKGQLTGFDESTTHEDGRRSHRRWEGGQYDEHGRLVAYKEQTVDADGAANWRHWKGAEYNSNNDLIGFSERSIDARGETRERVWRGEKYDRGLLTQYSETTTNSRGQVTQRDWKGSYGEKDRLSNFGETTIDAAGQIHRRAQDALEYDSLGRLVAYNETATDNFGSVSSQRWVATAFDDEDRVTSYETRETTSSGTRIRRRDKITHTATGRVTSYEEELADAETPDQVTRTLWSAGRGAPGTGGGSAADADAGYNAVGDLLSFSEKTTNPLGETESHQWTGRYDTAGRTLGYVDERTGALGDKATILWEAKSFDEYDRATSYQEAVETAQGTREKTWTGVYDQRGLVTSMRETVRSPNGLTATTVLDSATYDARGRLTDSHSTLQRSDMPDLVTEVTVAGQTYDDAGRVTGGTETTHYRGKTDKGSIDLTTTRLTSGAVVEGGRLSAYQDTKITRGTDDRGQAVHLQDVTDVTLGQNGDRTEVLNHKAFDENKTLLADRTTTLRTSDAVRDAQGRTLTARQETFSQDAPDAVSVTQLQNTYGAAGDAALSVEDTTEPTGARTVKKTETLGTDALGRATGTLTSVTRPGMTVTEEVTHQTGMTYDALGRFTQGHEESATTGPGLSTTSSLDRALTYDGAGNVEANREWGIRGGAVFDMTNINEAFDLAGRATAYHEVGWSADGGVTDNRRSGIKYNRFGQADSYTDEGIVGGQYRLNNHTALERDAFGREIRSLEEGINENGRYKYEGRTLGFNALGQVTGRQEAGWKADRGNYTLTQTGFQYDLAGRQVDFDQTLTTAGMKTQSHWQSKGFGENGAFLGYLEEGTILEGEGAGQKFHNEQAVLATDGRGQTLAYKMTSVKTFTDGSSQTTTTNWSDGAYNESGRLESFFEDTTTETVEKDGSKKTARTARQRHATSYYGAGGRPSGPSAALGVSGEGDAGSGKTVGEALSGFVSGYVETVYRDGEAETADRVEVRDTVYDENGLYFDSKTLTGKSDRFKDALRGILSYISGPDGALGKIRQGLTRLFDLTAGLAEKVGNWLEEAITGGKALLGRIMGLPSGAPEGLALTGTLRESLKAALERKIDTKQFEDLPVDLRPAAIPLSSLDVAPTYTGRGAMVYDNQGRAVRWIEHTLSAAAPGKEVKSQVAVTYDGTSNRIATYSARTVDGEKISHTFRDNFVYDAMGRSTYREATVEGDDLVLLETGEGDATALVPSKPVGWAQLSVSERTALLESVLSGAVQIVGRVDVYMTNEVEYDALGNVVSRMGDRLVRGNTFSELGLKQLIPTNFDQIGTDLLAGIKAEGEVNLAAQGAILDGLTEEKQKAEAELNRLKDLLKGKENEAGQAAEALANAQAAKDTADAALAQFKADLESLLANRELFRAYTGAQSIAKNPGNTYQDSRGLTRYYAAGDRVSVTDKYWDVVIRLREDGSVVRTFVRREVKRNLVMKSTGKSNNLSWSEESRELTEIEDPNPPRLPNSYGYDLNARGERILGKIPMDFGSLDPKDLVSRLSETVSQLKGIFGSPEGLKSVLPRGFSYTSVVRMLQSGGAWAPLIGGLEAVLAGQETATDRQTELATAQHHSDEAIKNKKAAEQERDLAANNSALAKSSLETGKIEVEAEKARIREEVARKETEVEATLASQMETLLKSLGASEVWVGGKAENFSEDFWKDLLQKGTAEMNGRSWDLGQLEEGARLRTSLAAEEKFARFDEGRQNASGVTWQGNLQAQGRGGPATMADLKGIVEKALSGSTAAAGQVALAISGDGRVSIHRAASQRQDGRGRVLDQNVQYFELTSQNGEVSARRFDQISTDMTYDNRGNALTYVRVTRESGKPDRTERLVGATYTATGQVDTSDVRVTDASTGYGGEVRILTDALSFNPDGTPRVVQRTQIKDGSVSIGTDLGLSRVDGLGRTIFSLTTTRTTTLEAWEACRGDVSRLAGTPTVEAQWNTRFNARGDVTSAWRMSVKSDTSGYQMTMESIVNRYSSNGQLAGSTIKTVEFGKSGAGTLHRVYTDTVGETQYDTDGRILRQRRIHEENGHPVETWDEEDRLYDALGRVIQTHSKTRSATGEVSESFWSGTYDSSGRVKDFYSWSVNQGRKTEERSVGAFRYDTEGRLVSQETEVTEWDETGQQSKRYRKKEEGFEYNLFGQVTAQSVTTTKTLADGTLSVETKRVEYGYDTQGRQVRTQTKGTETAGGLKREFEMVDEVLRFDANGRALRTRSTVVVDGLTTVRTSMENIQYDSRGRMVRGRDLVHQSGEGLSRYTEEAMETTAFDSWGRATAYTQTTRDGALQTVSNVHDIVYNADGLAVSQVTNMVETSLVEGATHRVERTITQTGMAYDALGRVIDYVKVVEEGGLATTSRPVHVEYDAQGRAINSLERVTDSAGRDEIVGSIGLVYNSLGQVVGGQTVSFNADAEALLDSGRIAYAVEAIRRGDLIDDGKARALVTALGVEGISSDRIVQPNRYDGQGRLVFSDVVNDSAGWMPEIPAFIEQVFNQTISRKDGWWWDQQLTKRAQELEAQGFVITGRHFELWGNTKKTRTCYATLTYFKPKTIGVSHERSTKTVQAFDVLGRPIQQTVVQDSGAGKKTLNQTLSYDDQGRTIGVTTSAVEEILNADGGKSLHVYQQSQTLAYNSLGQVSKEETKTWGDNQAPAKITTTTVDQITYQDGQRVTWAETTTYNDKTVADVRKITNATYDGQRRLSTYDSATYEKTSAGLKLLYRDLNARNIYDSHGRLAITYSNRVWGASETMTRKWAGPGFLKRAQTIETKKVIEEGLGGGGISALDENWTTGNATVVTTYEYANGGSSLSKVTTNAWGEGTHKERTVQSQGIRLRYIQSNIKYDSVGRMTSYHQSLTQVEKYDYVKQVQKGLKRKNAKKSTTGSVTTESDVQVLEYDDYGRQVHTITTSQRNDRNKVWTQTDARIKSFDDHGRALEVDRQTQSKATVEKKSGGLAAQIGSVVAVGVLCMTGVGIFVAAIVGAGLLAATSLGGQVINSFSHTVAVNQYKADGSLDEEATKAKTTTLEEYSYQQGTNFGDKVMTATDIAVAVVAVVATVMSGGALLPLLVVALGSFAYQGSRQGISINDFEANPDREQARASRMLVATTVASVATGGLTSGMAGGWLKGLVFASVNTGVATVGGADQETLMQVAAISFVTGALMGNAEKSANLATQATFSGAGTLISQTGVSFGKANQRTTWGLIGGTIGASGGDLSIAGMSAAKNTFLTLYSKKNDGSGGTDQSRMNQGFILSSWTELLGTLSALGMESKGRGKEPEDKLKGWAAVMDGAKKFAQGIGNWLVSPFKGLIRAPQSLRSNLIGMPLRPGTPAVAPRGSNDRRAPTDTETMNKEPLLDPPGTQPNSDSPSNLPGVSKQAIDKLPGAEPLNELPKLKPSLDLLPLPGLRLLPGLLSPRVEAGGESPADTLTARLMAYLYAWTPGNHTVTLLASAKEVLGMWDVETSGGYEVEVPGEQPIVLASAKMQLTAAPAAEPGMRAQPNATTVLNPARPTGSRLVPATVDKPTQTAAAEKPQGWWSRNIAKAKAAYNEYKEDVKTVAGFVKEKTVDGVIATANVVKDAYDSAANYAEGAFQGVRGESPVRLKYDRRNWEYSRNDDIDPDYVKYHGFRNAGYEVGDYVHDRGADFLDIFKMSVIVGPGMEGGAEIGSFKVKGGVAGGLRLGYDSGDLVVRSEAKISAGVKAGSYELKPSVSTTQDFLDDRREEIKVEPGIKVGSVKIGKDISAEIGVSGHAGFLGGEFKLKLHEAADFIAGFAGYDTRNDDHEQAMFGGPLPCRDYLIREGENRQEISAPKLRGMGMRVFTNIWDGAAWAGGKTWTGAQKAWSWTVDTSLAATSAAVRTGRAVTEKTIDLTDSAMTWTVDLSGSAVTKAMQFAQGGYAVVADATVMGAKGTVLFADAFIGLHTSFLMGGRIPEEPIPGYTKIAGPLATNQIYKNGSIDIPFYSVNIAGVKSDEPLAVVEMRHSYRTPPVSGISPWSSSIQMNRNEKSTDMSILFNFSPDDIARSVKSAKNLTFFVHGYNVRSEHSVQMGRTFTKQFVQRGYNNPGLTISWSGDIGTNPISKVIYFNRATRSADMSSAGLLRTQELIEGYNPKIEFSGATHSLGARLLLEAAAKGAKFDSVVLMVPAVQRGDFSAGGKYETAIQNIKRLTVVYSVRQGIVFQAFPIVQSDRGLGEVGPSGKVNHPDFLAIDATYASRNKYGIEITGHSDIYDPEMINLLMDRLRR